VSDANGVVTSGIGSDYGFGGPAGLPTCTTKAPSNQRYYFDFNSNDVYPQYVRCIQAQGNYLSSHSSAKVRLEGHCDNRGSQEYNVALGWRRANAVKNILLQRGVAPGQITAFSWGAQKQISKAAGDSMETWWAKNRRVDLFYKAY
jgi:peptidoglycan-associated lipoprotein